MSQYAYIDLTGAVVQIKDSNTTHRGSWSSSTSYVFKDVVLYNGRLFICLTANTNQTPPSLFTIDTPTYWASYVLVRGDAPSDPAIEALYAESVAVLALETAWNGTNTANLALGLAQQAVSHLSVAEDGTTVFWASTTQNGPLTDTQMTFIDGVLASKVVNNSLPMITNEAFSFVNFLNFVAPAGQSNNCFGTFVVSLLTPDLSWTNGNSYLYNRIGSQSIGGIASIQILDGPFESANVVMNFQDGGSAASTYAALTGPDQVTQLFPQGTYYIWNRDGAPIEDVIVSLRLDGIAFIGG